LEQNAGSTPLKLQNPIEALSIANSRRRFGDRESRGDLAPSIKTSKHLSFLLVVVAFYDSFMRRIDDSVAALLRAIKFYRFLNTTSIPPVARGGNPQTRDNQ
jgi:hypothetical protein